jgi:hypothetical protein
VARRAAFPLIEVQLVPERQTPDIPALKAKSRRRDLYLFVEPKILSVYLKIILTVLTYSFFGIGHWF